MLKALVCVTASIFMVMSWSAAERQSKCVPVTTSGKQEQPVVNAVARRLDELNGFGCEDEIARLDFYAVELQNDPLSEGYVIAYGGRQAKRDEAQARLARIREYLVENRGVDSARIKIVDGGHRAEAIVELWVKPVTAIAPAATPTLKKNQVILKGKAGKADFSCKQVWG